MKSSGNNINASSLAVNAAAVAFGAGASLVAAKMLDDRYYIRKDMRIIMGLGSFAIIMKQREIFYFIGRNTGKSR